MGGFWIPDVLVNRFEDAGILRAACVWNDCDSIQAVCVEACIMHEHCNVKVSAGILSEV